MSGEFDNSKRVEKIDDDAAKDQVQEHPLLAELQNERALTGKGTPADKTDSVADRSDVTKKVEDPRVAAAEKAAEMTGPQNLAAAVQALERAMKLASSLPSDVASQAFMGANFSGLLKPEEASPAKVSELLSNLQKIADMA